MQLQLFKARESMQEIPANSYVSWKSMIFLLDLIHIHYNCSCLRENKKQTKKKHHSGCIGRRFIQCETILHHEELFQSTYVSALILRTLSL